MSSTSHVRKTRSFARDLASVYVYRKQRARLPCTSTHVHALWFTVTAVHGPFGHCSSHEKVQKAPDRIGSGRTKDVRTWLWLARRPAPDPRRVSGLQHRSIGRGVLRFPSLDPSNERDRCRCGSRGLIALGSLIKKRNRRSGAVRYVRFIVVPDLARMIFPPGEIATGPAAGGRPGVCCGHASICALDAR